MAPEIFSLQSPLPQYTWTPSPTHMHTHAPHHPGMALLMSAKLPFKCSGPLGALLNERTGCLVTRATSRKATVSLPPFLYHGPRGLASILGKQEIGTKTTLSSAAGNSYPWPCRPLSSGRGQHDWSETPIHLYSAPGGARWPGPSSGVSNQGHSARLKHDSGQHYPKQHCPSPL